MARRHHIMAMDLLPDPYESLPQNKRTVFHVMDVVGAGDNQHAHAISPYNYDEWNPTALDHDNQPNGMWTYMHPTRPGAFGTHKVVDCDEISFFAQPLKYNLGWNPSAHLERIDIRQSDLDGTRMFQSNVGTLDQYNNTYGNYFPWGDNTCMAAFYRVGQNSSWPTAGFKIYTDNTKTVDITDGWSIPNTPQMLQLIGQLPRHNELDGTGDRYDDLKDFFWADESTDVINVINPNWGHKDNISGIGILPGGVLPNTLPGQENSRPALVTAFASTSSMPTWNTAGSIALTTFAVTGSPWHQPGLRLSSSVSFAYGGNIRYCKVKTADELGYRLIADRLTDEVNFELPSYDVDAINAVTPPIVQPTPDPVEVFLKKQENGTYNWNHPNTLGYTNQSLLRGNKIVEVQVEMALAGIWHLVVTSNNQADPLIVKRYYPFNVNLGWNTITCDIDLANNEFLMLGAYNLNLPDNSGTFTDTARQRVVYPSTVSPYGGAVFTRNNGQTVNNMDPNVSITIQPPTPAPIPRYLEIPTGIERGVALRYSNRDNKIVLNTWSAIQDEANQLKTSAILNIDN